MSRPRHVSSRSGPGPFAAVLAALAIATGALAAWRFEVFGGSGDPPPGPAPRIFGASSPPPTPLGPTASPPAPASTPAPRPINTGVEGLTTFRGNATRTYYGEGPVPTNPTILWRYPPTGGLCGQSTDGSGTRTWCGTGWTGQPNVVEVKNRVEVRFGAYDYGVHVLNGRTGRSLKEPFATGDLIKGTVTTDPDGFPLLYTGSRDNRFRVLATDRGRRLVELWSLDASSAPRPLWNDDWDGSALVIDDYLIEGGENSWFYVVKLNREYGDDGKVTVDPEVRLVEPGFDDELLSALGDQQVSIESSVAFDDGVAFFANSGGLVQGWDISGVLEGGTDARRVFRFWTGDDVDASIVVDDEGYLYVASELERFNRRAQEVGQLVKLDPRRPDDPVVWSVAVPGEGGAGGIWATPALHGRFLYVPTNTGRILGVVRKTGRIRWEFRLPGPVWSSPAVVDDVMVLGDCSGMLRAFDVSKPGREPPELWSIQLEGCIESTPAIWKGRIFVGARGGAVYGIGDVSDDPG